MCFFTHPLFIFNRFFKCLHVLFGVKCIKIKPSAKSTIEFEEISEFKLPKCFILLKYIMRKLAFIVGLRMKDLFRKVALFAWL